MEKITENFIKRSENFVDTEIDGDIVMMDTESGGYFALGLVASEIWRYIESPKKYDDIIDFLLKKYKVSEEQCKKETLEFINEMIEKKIVKYT